MTNPLDDFPAVRKALYLVQWLVSVALFVTTAVVLVITEGNVPTWLAAVTAGFNAYTVVTGRTAQSNTTDPETDIETLTDEDGDEWGVYEDDEDLLHGDEIDEVESDPELDLELSKE